MTSFDDCWRVLCPVDVGPLVDWLASGTVGWPPVKGGQPNRVHLPDVARPIIDHVLRTCFTGPVTYQHYYACLSRLVPGATYEYHRDPQPPEWLTRVHVPIVTNPLAWLRFQEQDERVHFDVGFAYSFNTLRQHCYGNDGVKDRVHLLFDVLRIA